MSACKRFDTGWLCDTGCTDPAHDEFLTAPEATDPTPGEVGLSEAEREALSDGYYNAQTETDALAAVERILAARTAARDVREAELRATDFTPVVAAHQRRLDPAGSCTCGGWPTEPRDVPWTDHLAGALRAALTIPPTTEDGKR